MWSNQYIENNIMNKSKEEREKIGKEIKQINEKHELWVKDFMNNRMFYIKYSSLKYEKPYLLQKRNIAYKKRYNAGFGFKVEFNVIIRRNHYLDGKIQIGNNVVLANNIFIDYSGDLKIGNNVNIAEGVKIFTHSHPSFLNSISEKQYAIKTKIEINDSVTIGADSLILESTKKIGRYAKIGAGTVIRTEIPPYSIVIGNPAKIIGFIMKPEEVYEFEKEKYPEEERTDMKKFEKIYNKVFFEKNKELLQYSRLY